MKSEDLFFHSLKAISPIDGRHRIITEPLSEYFSEFALFKYRIYMEVEYLIALSELESFTAIRKFTEEEKEFLRKIAQNFSLEEAQVIQNIDRFGYQEKGPVNHDFKATEYFLMMKIEPSSLKEVKEFVHFGLTSEDANNIAYNCMIRGALRFHYLPKMRELLDKLSELAEKEKETAMLSRTHGQAATPTTFGKEMANFLERLRKQLVDLTKLKLPAKINGAVGNHAAQQFAAPEIDWIKFTTEFITKLGFEPNLLTTQIEPHDGLTKFGSSLLSINNILRGLSIDLWLYISQDYLIQKKIAAEIGSSTMPHKINPWLLEVAEGSSVEANAKLSGFIQKWQTSRLQRDLSDHEAQRATGVALAHSYVTIVYLLEGLNRLQTNPQKMREELQNEGSILTEAVQTLLRKEGYEKPYELMKDFSRGKDCTIAELHWFIDTLEIKAETKQRLKELKPEQYTGLSAQLVDIAVNNWHQFKEEYEGKSEQESMTKQKPPQVVAILGGQWGDEGKGKIVDLMAGNFHLAARATGGNNAGHTVLVGQEKHIFHLVPSAVTWEGVDCLLGNGMVIDPLVLLKEIHTLKQKGYPLNNLFISGRAHLILLYHKVSDWFQEETKGQRNIGTTGRGIGPSYADKVHRTGIRVNDLFNKELLAEKIKHHLQEKLTAFKHLHQKEEPEILNQLQQSLPEEPLFDQYREKFAQIYFLDRERLADLLVEMYFSLGQKLKPYVTETGLKLEQAYVEGKNILLEGAQGILLDYDHGTYPFVTSSNPTLGGFKTGLGFPYVDQTYSVLKAYTTRVGSGPFPTELNDHLGRYLREKGQEYGSTTGRPRRCGWHDAVLTRHTARVNGRKVIITKLDVLSGLEKLKICNSYRYHGPTQTYDGEEFYPGKIITEFPADGYFLEYCQPHEWIELEGWPEEINTIRNYEDLPEKARKYLQKIAELGNVEICLVSVGPERGQTIFIPEKWNLPIKKQEKSGEVISAEEKILPPGKIKAIIYDLDNTLTATNQFVLNLIKRTALHTSQEIYFFPPGDEEIIAVQKKNLSLEEMFSTLFPNPPGYPREEPLWRIILHKYRERGDKMPYTSTYQGRETVRELKEKGLIQGVLTNRTRLAKERLEQAGYPELNFILSPENKKPDPKAFNEVLAVLENQGISKKEIIAVGDHSDDYLAAKGAGIAFLAVLSGLMSKEEFMKLGLEEEKIINDLSQLKDSIRF